ncbi:hypothetical protein ID866_3064 [Astraeus odoratus]|nr:hypothetical protein ID866_3064 [Astraeus odoratus]
MSDPAEEPSETVNAIYITRSKTKKSPPEVAPATIEIFPDTKIAEVQPSLSDSSPEHPRHHSEEGHTPPKSPSKSEYHQTSSPSSARRTRSTPSTRMGPLSAGSPVAMPPPTSPLARGRPESSPADDADETESIAESSHGTRIRRNEAERLQYFNDQPDCGALELHRAFCRRCGCWVGLGKRQSYTVRPWEKHRAKCDLKSPIVQEAKPVSTEASPSEIKKEDVISIKEEPTPTSPAPSLAPSVVANESSSPTASKSPRKTEAERLAILQADPRAQEIRPHEVLCRSCHKWIKLSSTHSYTLRHWDVHQERCPGSKYVPRPLRPAVSKQSFSPGSRVATAERKIALLNDPQVRTASPRKVHCALCKATVTLEGDVDYDLAKWNEHKTTCIPMTPAPPQPLSRSSSRLSNVFPPSTPGVIATPTPTGRVLRGPTSSGSASTDAMLVTDSSTTQAGTKRAREDETDGPEGDRPSNRPRTEDYKPPEREAPGPWGWFMQPLKAFVRGFREGLGTPTT